MNNGIFGFVKRPWDQTDTQPPGGVAPTNAWWPIITNANANVAAAQHREYVAMFDIWWPTRITWLGVAQTVVGTDSARHFLGVRTMMMSGQPGPLVAAAPPEDATATTGTGSKWVVINCDLDPGRYCICFMANNWTTTAPSYRASNGSNDVFGNGYGLPRLAPRPESVSTALPSGGNYYNACAFRATDGTGLTAHAASDWQIGAAMPAVYAQGHPL